MTARLSLWSPPTRNGADFRPIQYLGGKWRLLDAISTAVVPLLGNSQLAVCDLFSGTGVVAARLARTSPVLAADVQEYSRVLGSALLHPRLVDLPHVVDAARMMHQTMTTPELARLSSYEAAHLARAPASAHTLCELLEHGSIEAGLWRQGTTPQVRDLILDVAGSLSEASYSSMTRYYGGVYFSYRQASQLDALTAAAHSLAPAERDTALAAVLSTASELVASIGGHFAQPVRPRAADGRVKPGVALAVAKSRQLDAFDVFGHWLERYTSRRPAAHRADVRRADFAAVLTELPDDIGCVYADPPYTRDHYSRFYHVLETIAMGDDPGLSTMTLGGRVLPSRGLYREDRHQSPFCVVSRAPLAFAELFACLSERGVPLVLSYSPIPQTVKPRARVMTLDALAALAGRYFPRVDVQAVQPIAHAKLNAVRLNASRTFDAEVLIIAQPERS